MDLTEAWGHRLDEGRRVIRNRSNPVIDVTSDTVSTSSRSIHGVFIIAVVIIIISVGCVVISLV
jgi:hypothetical protein